MGDKAKVKYNHHSPLIVQQGVVRPAGGKVLPQLLEPEREGVVQRGVATVLGHAHTSGEKRQTNVHRVPEEKTKKKGQKKMRTRARHATEVHKWAGRRAWGRGVPGEHTLTADTCRTSNESPRCTGALSTDRV